MYYIRVDEYNRITTTGKTSLIDLQVGDIEITEEQYNLIHQSDSANYHYFYVGGVVNREINNEKQPQIEVPHEEVTKQTYSMVDTNSFDTLINMELGEDTNTKVTMTGSDSLLLIEMLVIIDEKLTQLLSPKA